MIEFLNDNMPLLEVAAVEVAHYTSDAGAAFVPRVLGQTERSKQAKSSRNGPRTQATREGLLASLPSNAAHWVSALLEAAKGAGLTPYWGTKGVSLGVQKPSGRQSALYVYPPGTFGSDAAAIYVFLGQYLEKRHSEIVEHLEGLGLIRTGKRTLMCPLEEVPEFSPGNLVEFLIAQLSIE